MYIPPYTTGTAFTTGPEFGTNVIWGTAFATGPEFGTNVIWEKLDPCVRSHVVVVQFEKEEDGVSAIVLNLPGCVSQGDDFDDAVKNVREAIDLTIESYIEDGKKIPWCRKWESEPRPLFTEWRKYVIEYRIGGNNGHQ